MTVIWRRKILLLAIGLIAISVLTNPRSVAARPAPGDCTTLQIASNGFHTNFYLPADIFPAESAIRSEFPGANWFIIGWGDEGFYRDGASVSRVIQAMVPPSPTVLHIIATVEPPETLFLDKTVTVAVSEAGLDEVVRLIQARFARDPQGQVIRLSDGHYAGASAFYRARGSYHAFHTCNQWLAGILRRAGVPINAPSAIPAQSVMWQLNLRAPKTCPEA